MAFPSGMVAAVFLPPTHSRRGEGETGQKRESALPASGSWLAVRECGSVSLCVASLYASLRLCLSILSLQLSQSLLLSGCVLGAWGVRECVRRRETELGVPCACVGACVGA